jgi:hypothetical protein
MLELKGKRFCCIDLTANPNEPTEWRSLRNKVLETCLHHKGGKTLEILISTRSAQATMDAPQFSSNWFLEESMWANGQ